MKHVEEKREYLYKHQKGLCDISGKPLTNHSDLHHSCIHNTQNNRFKFPLFIDSIMNLRLVDHLAHMGNPSHGDRMSDYRARKVEDFLKRHKKISEFVNNPKIKNKE